MLKRITLLAVFFATLASTSSFAQNAAVATQTVHIQIAPSIEIENNNGNGNGHGNGNNNGHHGNGNNGNGNNNGHHGNGNNGNGNGNGRGGSRMSGNGNNTNHGITVNSTDHFIVSVKAIDDISGENILIALSDNNTGGEANPVFNSGFGPVSATSQDLLMNCGFGDDKNFSINYKTKNNKKEQRVTKADIIYTATLP